MNDQLLTLIKNSGSLVHFKNGVPLFHEGDICQGMLIVTSGSIKVIKFSLEGKEALLYRVNPENICILSVSCLIGNNHYNAEGIAESDLDGVFISHHKFLELINTHQGFREFIFNNFAQRISDFIQKIDEIIFKSVKERLVKFIQDYPSHEILKTHHELAVELGTGREVISRLLKSLENEGSIDLSRNSIKKRLL